MITLAPRRSFTATEYHRMADAGILLEDDPVELIMGEIVEMSAIGVAHVNCVNALAAMLYKQVGPDVEVSMQNPILLRFDTEPEPDAVLARAQRDKRTVPKPEDILLVIEVSDSSLAYDHSTKLPLYAAANIAEAWIIDLNGKLIERHTEPQDGRYRRVGRARSDGSLSSTTVPAVTLEVNALIG